MAPRSSITRADVKTAEAVAPVRDSMPVRLLGTASELADQPQLITLCVATLAAGLFLHDRRLADTGGRMLAAELIATGLKGVVKANVDRTRPYVVADGGDHVLEAGHSQESRDNSFPSGHTAGAVAVARAIVRGYPERAGVACLVAAAVAAIQIPRCKHYPSDLLAGAAIGLAANAMVAASERLVLKLTE